jgi:flagellar biosynthesis/type III secretory pathway protein FliH
MLYKFKSQVASDLIMLQAHGRRILEIVGKDPAGPGILTPAETPAALQALEDAIQAEQAARAEAIAQAAREGLPPPRFEAISLSQRAHPMLDLLRRSAKAGKPVIWECGS